MADINIEKNGDYEFLAGPSGNKITASKLEKGKSYLHKNLLFVRTILVLTNNDVFYADQVTTGMCSISHFVATCPYEATKEEVEFLSDALDGI